MLIVRATLLGVLYWIGETNLPFVRLWAVQRPLVCGWITGTILGDALTGVMVGASISLAYSGFISARRSMPADMAPAGTLGAALVITDNLDADIAPILTVSIGLLGTLVWYYRMTFDSIFVHIGDRFVEKEQYNKIWIANVLLSQIMAAVIRIASCSLAAYFGATYIQGFITMLTGTPLKTLQIIGGLMPALGTAVTLQYIFKGESRAFLFIGSVVAVYSGLALLPFGVLSLLCALVYVQVRYREGSGRGNIAEESELEEDF